MSTNTSKLRTELKIVKVLHIVSVFMLLLLSISITVDTFNNTLNLTGEVYMKIQLWVCLYFLFSLFIELLFSKDKLRFLWRNLFFILISIPYLNIFQVLDITFSPEVTYFLRFIPLIRGCYALGYVILALSRQKVSGVFFSYITILFSLMYFYSLIFYVFEYKVNPNVHSYYDALWWTAMEATTTGSSIEAVTPVGKIMSVIAAISGITMFPFFTVYITSLIQKMNNHKHPKKDNLDIQK